MVPPVLVEQVGRGKPKDSPLIRLLRLFGSTRQTLRVRQTPPRADNDPYLLLLLADQELAEGREEQARYLIEAAYECFDQKMEAKIVTLYRAS